MARYIATPEVPTGFANRCVYATPGTYTFTVPSGVTSITAIAVGGGSDGSQQTYDDHTYIQQHFCLGCGQGRVCWKAGWCPGYTYGGISDYACRKVIRRTPCVVSKGFVYSGSGGGFAQKTIAVSPGECFSVTVGDKEETSSFGAHISATGASAPTVNRCPTFPSDHNTVLGSDNMCRNCYCSCCQTCCWDVWSCFCFNPSNVCIKEYFDCPVTSLTFNPGCGIGGDVNYTGGAGSYCSFSIFESVPEFIGSYMCNCCCCHIECMPHSYWEMASNYSGCCSVMQNAGACQIAAYSSGAACDFANNLTNSTIRGIRGLCICTYMTDSDFQEIESYYCDGCYRCHWIEPTSTSNGANMEYAKLCKSGPSSGSPVGNGQNGADSCYPTVAVLSTTSCSFPFQPDCYEAFGVYIRCISAYRCCTTGCWSNNARARFHKELNPWAIKRYNNTNCYTCAKASCICHGIYQPGLPGNYLFGTPTTGGSIGCTFPPVNMTGECANGTCQCMPSCQYFNGAGNNGCAHWLICNPGYCGCGGDDYSNPKGVLFNRYTYGACNNNCTNLGMNAYFMAGVPTNYDTWSGCNYEYAPDMSQYCLRYACIGFTQSACNINSCCWTCKQAILANSCLITPGTTPKQFIAYMTHGQPWVARMYCCHWDTQTYGCWHCAYVGLALTLSTYFRCCGQICYCNESANCCAELVFNICHVNKNKNYVRYTCYWGGNWAPCNSLSTTNQLDTEVLVLPGSAGGPASAGNIPCLVSSTIYASGQGADPAGGGDGYDIPKYITTGSSGAVMSSDTFTKIVDTYNGDIAAWYLRECWLPRCSLYENGATICCNCCVKPISHMDCGLCCCRCVLESHYRLGCVGDACSTCGGTCVCCYSIKLITCFYAELINVQGLQFDAGNGFVCSPCCATVTTAQPIIPVGATAGLYINGVSNNFVGQKTCLSGGASSTKKYAVQQGGSWGVCFYICDSATANCQWANAFYAGCINASGCQDFRTACLNDDPTQKKTGPTSQYPCTPFYFSNYTLSTCCWDYYTGALTCSKLASISVPTAMGADSGGSGGSQPYTPEIYTGPKLADEYLFSTSDCILGGSPHICIVGSTSTIAPGYSQGGGKAGCIVYLCDDQPIVNNAYNGGIFPRGTPGAGGGGTIHGQGGSGLVVVYWN